jgi:hypothetical protein
MSVKDEAKLIFERVIQELGAIANSPKKEEKQSEYIELHWCPQCNAYHKKK